MKKFFMISALAIATLIAGCSESGTDEGNTKVEPNFPAATTPSIAAGEHYTIELTPNCDWTISIPAEKMAWFWIQDGNQKVGTVRGKAGEKASVEIHTSDVVEYDQTPTCDVTMTMNGKNKVIATITRTAAERKFSLYRSVVEDGTFSYSESGSGLSYQYESEPTTSVSLIWPEELGCYYFPILVEANFKWYIKSYPEELIAAPAKTEGNAGDKVEIRLEGKNVIGDKSGRIVFCAASNPDVEFYCDITVPDCSLKFAISGIEPESLFDSEGQYGRPTQNGTTEWYEKAVAEVRDLKGTQIFVFVEKDYRWSFDEEDTKWVQATIADWDAEGDAVLQSRDLTVTVSKNEGAERKAKIYAVPAAKVPESANSLLGSAYDQYFVTELTQLKSAAGGGSTTVVPVTPIDMGDLATFGALAAENAGLLSSVLPGQTIPEGFELHYYSMDAVDRSELKVDRAFTAKFYDKAFKELEQPVVKEESEDEGETTVQPTPWLTAHHHKDDNLLRILMYPRLDEYNKKDVDNEGYVVLFDAGEKPFALIRCLYTEPEPVVVPDYITLVNPACGAVLDAKTSQNAADLIEKYSGIYNPAVEEEMKVKAELTKELQEDLSGQFTAIYVLGVTSAAPVEIKLDYSLVTNLLYVQNYASDWIGVDDSKAPVISIDLSARKNKGDYNSVDFYVGRSMGNAKYIKVYCIANF